MTEAKSRRRRTIEKLIRLISIPSAMPTSSTPTKAWMGGDGLPSTKMNAKSTPITRPLTAPERAAAP